MWSGVSAANVAIGHNVAVAVAFKDPAVGFLPEDISASALRP
jgi:hypothetical protein